MVNALLPPVAVYANELEERVNIVGVSAPLLSLHDVERTMAVIATRNKVIYLIIFYYNIKGPNINMGRVILTLPIYAENEV